MSRKLIGISDAYMDKAKTSNIKTQSAMNYVGNVFSDVLFNHHDSSSSTIATIKTLPALEQPLGTGFTTASSLSNFIVGSTDQQHDAEYDEDGISVLTGDARHRDELDDDARDSSPSHHTVALRAAELSWQSTGGIDGERERYAQYMPLLPMYNYEYDDYMTALGNQMYVYMYV